MQDNLIEIVRETERARITGLSRVTWWRLERDGKAPKRVQLGPSAVGWVRAELFAWVRERAGRDIQVADYQASFCTRPPSA